jgi:hypothetical protein
MVNEDIYRSSMGMNFSDVGKSAGAAVVARKRIIV